MLECELTKAGLMVYVRSQSRPQSKMMAECGFGKDAAVVAVVALAEKVNERFGDAVSPKSCLAGLKKFFDSGVDLKCRSCGWRKPKTIFCTQQGVTTSDGDTCDEFRHVFKVTE